MCLILTPVRNACVQQVKEGIDADAAVATTTANASATATFKYESCEAVCLKRFSLVLYERLVSFCLSVCLAVYLVVCLSVYL